MKPGRSLRRDGSFISLLFPRQLHKKALSAICQTVLFYFAAYTRPVSKLVFPGQSSCLGCCRRTGSVLHQRTRSSVSGHRRYNTLDLASKIVCQQGCFSPLLETQSHGASPLEPCQRGSPFGFPTASGQRKTVSHTVFHLSASRQSGAQPLFESPR